MNKYYAAEVAEYWHGLQLACAHNEWLNMLVTEGFLGLAAYLGIFISSMVRASKHVKEEPVLIALMAGILAYIGHNVFCYQQCICTPVVFIFVGIVEVILRSKRSKEA
jgi:O-antigen ligase